MIRHSRVCRYNDVDGDADDAYMMMVVVVMMSMMMLVMIVMMVHGEGDDVVAMLCVVYDRVAWNMMMHDDV